MLTYEMPLAEIVLDFFDKLKSVSRGYASMDYEFKEYRAADVVKVDILLNGDKVDALSIIVHRSQSQYRSRAVVAKMRELISRQMYDVAIQAAIGANIIARETIKALRKNVIAKCYGGDITRKKQAARKTKGRQEAHEADRLRRGAAGGVSGHPPSGRLMGLLTGLLYACLAVFLGGWYFGNWTRQLLAAALHPDRRHVRLLAGRALLLRAAPRWPPRRRSSSRTPRAASELARQGITKVDDNVAATRQALLMQPWWLDWTAGLFPVILVVFLLRSFLFEPFKIPSGSMIPTLLVGDLILVNKFHYGVRLPVINKKIIANHDPQRGDVMVFRYPKDPSIDYIKRVVGVPGDEVVFRNQQLFVNGQPVPVEPMPPPEFYDEEARRYVARVQGEARRGASTASS